MKVKAWNNGSHGQDGNGYGIKIDAADRDRFFKRDWGTVIIDLGEGGESVEVNIGKDSFWNTKCRELISVEIGKWLIKNDLAPWPARKPPSLVLHPLGGRHFLLASKN